MYCIVDRRCRGIKLFSFIFWENFVSPFLFWLVRVLGNCTIIVALSVIIVFVFTLVECNSHWQLVNRIWKLQLRCSLSVHSLGFGEKHITSSVDIRHSHSTVSCANCSSVVRTIVYRHFKKNPKLSNQFRVLGMASLVGSDFWQEIQLFPMKFLDYLHGHPACFERTHIWLFWCEQVYTLRHFLKGAPCVSSYLTRSLCYWFFSLE